MYDETLGKWHFWLSTISVNFCFSPALLGLAECREECQIIPFNSLVNMISSIGGWVYGLVALFVYIIINVFGRQKASDRVWDGAHGLEWTLSSPAPYHSFDTPPDPSTIEGGLIKISV